MRRQINWSVFIIVTSVIWIWSVHQTTLGMRPEGTENLFLSKTYQWLSYSLMSLGCFTAFFLLSKRVPRKFLGIMGGTVCSITLFLQLASPIGISTDYYRYVWQGRVSNAGQDNYNLRPWDAGVEKANDELFERMDWRDVKSVYPPLAEEYFRVPAAIFDSDVLHGTSFQTRLSFSKLPNLLLFIICAFLLYKITSLKLLGMAWLAFPLLQLELVNSAHIDVLSIALLLGALWGLKSTGLSAHLLTGLLIATAGLVKLAPFVIIVPAAAYLFVNYSFKRALATIGTFLATTTLFIQPFITNDLALVKRIGYWLSGNEFSLGNPLYELAKNIPDGFGTVTLKTVTLSLAIAIIISIIRQMISRKVSYDSVLWFSLLLLLIPFIASPIVLPWYWLTPLSIMLLKIFTKGRRVSKTELVSLLLICALIFIQYIDRAIETTPTVRQNILTIAGLATYGAVLYLLHSIFRIQKLDSKQGGVKS